MSKQAIKVTIEICSNCKQHAWCTRHNQANYLTLAQQIVKSIRAQSSSIQVQVLPVGGTKMGSFEVICQGHVLFSKITLGYFPHVTAVTKRVMSFIEDYKKGGDLTKYQPGVGSPVRCNSAFNKTSSTGFQKSPVRRNLQLSQHQQQSKETEKEKESSKKEQKKETKGQEATFVVDQKKSEKKIERGQVIIPETKKSETKIQSQKKVEQKKESQQFIIEKKEEHKQQAKPKHQHKQEKPKHEHKQEKPKEEHKQVKTQEKIKTQQFILDQKTNQHEKKQQKPESIKKVEEQTKQHPKQGQKHQKSEQQAVVEMITSIFNEYDKDKSGKLEKREVKKMMEFILNADDRKGLKVTEVAIRKWISEADTDGDGIVSLQEFINFFLENQ